MTTRATVPLAEIAELVAAVSEEAPAEEPADGRGGRRFRAALLDALKRRYGADWVRAWNYVAARRDGRS